MSLLGNILWMIFGGLVSAFSWLASGCLWCITIVGIPVGLPLALMPFGATVH